MPPKKNSIFTPLTESEIDETRKEWQMIHEGYSRAFEKRTDVTRRPDGSYDVKGDVQDHCSPDFRGLAVKYGNVGGNFSCGGTFASLEGAPRTVGGDFSFHGELGSLERFPEEVKGDVLFINHPIPGDRPGAKRWTEIDIKKACRKVGGKVTVENHYGI